MAAVPTNLGEGGKGLSPRGNSTPSLATIFADLITDLATLKGADPTATAAAAAVSATAPSTTAQADASATAGGAITAIATADIAAFTDPPSAGEMALLRTLVNELKAKHNATVTRVEATVTATDAAAALATAVKAKINTTITYALDIAAQYAIARTLVNVLRTTQITRGGATLLTTQGS